MTMTIKRRFVGRMSGDFTTIFGTVELHSLEQFYTRISKNDEVQYETTDDGFVKTVTKDNGSTREECPVTEDEWNAARKNIIGNYIETERLEIPFDNIVLGHLTIEIDVFSRPHTNGWAVIEIEFPDEEKAKLFLPAILPSDVLRAFTRIIDVTDDERFKNASIALFGFPTYIDAR